MQGVWGGVNEKTRKQFRTRMRKVTMSITDNPERQKRVAVLWAAHPDWPSSKVIAEVDAQLADEDARRAEADARSKEFDDSFERMTGWKSGCACCNAEPASDSNGLGSLCRPIVGLARAERRALDKVGKFSRRQLAEAYLNCEEKGA
jgi:hypothetical protein